MRDITANEIRALLTITKEYTTKYNANSLSKTLGMSAMGALKITRKLQEQGLIDTETIGKANIFRITYEKTYTRQLLSLLLRKEAEEAAPRVKRWITELRKLETSASIGVLFGSVLSKEEYKDIDVFVTLEQKEYEAFTNTLDAINQLSEKRVHAIKQTKKDLQENLRKKDAVIMNAIKGIVLFGYDEYIKVLANVTRQEQYSTKPKKA